MGCETLGAFLMHSLHVVGAVEVHSTLQMLLVAAWARAYAAAVALSGPLRSQVFQPEFALETFAIHENNLRGTWPSTALGNVPLLIHFGINTNRFAGTWPGDALSRVPCLTIVKMNRNDLTGSWPPQALSRVKLLEEFSLSYNSVTGTWPQYGLTRVQELSRYSIFYNRFTGTWPSEGTVAVPLLRAFSVAKNYMTGTWPSTGLASLTNLDRFSIYNNNFAGAWPSEAFSRSAPLQTIYMYGCLFAGTWPNQTLSRLPVLVRLTLALNSFTGTWPPECLGKVPALTQLSLAANYFSGTWRDDALEWVPAMTHFTVPQNFFTGTWPAMALARLRFLKVFDVSGNLFGGQLRCAMPTARLSDAEISLQVMFSVYDTSFEGTLSTRLARLPQLWILRAGDTWLEGSLPRELAMRQFRLRFLSLKGLQLEGTAPTSLQRMSAANTSLVLGHGLSGVMPTLSGTLAALSTFRNNFEGHMPMLRVATWSILVVHSNLLACDLPSYGFQKTTLSLALLGNHFRRPKAFPAWIHNFERGDAFVIGDRDARNVLLKVMASIFLLAVVASLKVRRDSQRGVSREPVPLRFYEMHAKVLFTAFKASCARFIRSAPAAAIVMLLYLRGATYACMAVLGRLHMPLMSQQLRSPVHINALFVAATSSDCVHIAATYHCAKLATVLKGSQWHTTTALVWAMWLVLCCCISAPGAMYSMLMTIPGLMQGSRLLSWLIMQSVTLATFLITVVALPRLARRLRTFVTQEELLSVGNLLAVPVIPCVAAFIFNAHCLGQWARLWEPCMRNPSVLNELEQYHLQYFQTSFSYNRKSSRAFYTEGLLRREEICQRGRMSGGRCVDALLEWSMPLLVGTAVHLAFTGPALRIASGRRMKAGSAWVHLVRTWTLSLVSGSFMPLLCAFAAVNVLVHVWLLFGSLNMLRRKENKLTEDAKARMPILSMYAAQICTLLLQLVLIIIISRNAAA